MLNKKICKKCKNEEQYLRWDMFDDKNWKAGEAWCPIVRRYFNIKRCPPKECRYILEQMVIGT